MDAYAEIAAFCCDILLDAQGPSTAASLEFREEIIRGGVMVAVQ